MTPAGHQALVLSQYIEDDCNLVVRVPPTLRRRVKLAAIRSDLTLRDYVELAIRERMARVTALPPPRLQLPAPDPR